MDLRFRRLFLLRFSLVLWSFFLLYTSGFLAFEIVRPDEALETRRRLDLEQQTRQAQDFVARHREADLVESLRHSLRQGRLDYFAWKENGRLLSAEGKVPPAEVIPDGQVIQQGSLLLTRVEAGPASLEFGVDVGWRARAMRIWEHERLPWVKDYALLAFSLGLILYVFFRDLAKASYGGGGGWRSERPRPAPKSLRQELAPTAEPELSPAGLYGAITFALPLGQGSQAETLKEKYELTRRILKRYGAELISVEREIFLASFPADSAAAGAAARDLAREGAAVSMAAGDAELVSLGSLRTAMGPAWAGILSALRSPSFGRVRMAPNGPALTMPLFREQGGWQEPVVDVQGAIALARGGDPDFLKYFRHDQDLRAVLLSFANQEWETPALLPAVGALRSFQCPDGGSSALAEAYALFLAKELSEGDRYRLGVTLALSTHLLAPAAVSPALEALFLKAVASPDLRTKANAIEVFIHFFPEREFPELKAYVRDGDNRLSAIALIKAALEHFDDKVIRLLETRIKGGSVAHVASALYAYGEIAAHYRRLDPHYLSTKEPFLALSELLPNLARHPNPMVRRQALQAARKLGNAKVDERLRLVFEGCEEEEIRELFATIYGWRKEEQSAA